MVLCLLWMVLGPSSLTLVLTLAEPAMVFILLELRELEEFGVWRVPEGLSATSCDDKQCKCHNLKSLGFTTINE